MRLSTLSHSMLKQAELPKWPGADEVYRKLYSVLEYMGNQNWKEEIEKARKQRRPPQPTGDMHAIMNGLAKGDEENLKELVKRYYRSAW